MQHKNVRDEENYETENGEQRREYLINDNDNNKNSLFSNNTFIEFYHISNNYKITGIVELFEIFIIQKQATAFNVKIQKHIMINVMMEIISWY